MPRAVAAELKLALQATKANAAMDRMHGMWFIGDLLEDAGLPLVVKVRTAAPLSRGCPLAVKPCPFRSSGSRIHQVQPVSSDASAKATHRQTYVGKPSEFGLSDSHSDMDPHVFQAVSKHCCSSDSGGRNGPGAWRGSGGLGGAAGHAGQRTISGSQMTGQGFVLSWKPTRRRKGGTRGAPLPLELRSPRLDGRTISKPPQIPSHELSQRGRLTVQGSGSG